ncbi:MAG: ATP phosphoribosyltransferase regulatory subunit, partial [Candidatus Rokuibacteriota bacterium]
MKLDTAPPRGMKDLLPPEVELRDRASATIMATYTRYGFRRVETPALENLRLLLGSGGGENEKLIYKVLKRGAKLDAATQHEDGLADLGLRFDLTVPLARYYAHNRATLPDPFKAIQIGPVWRAERPQKGRFRQFTQCDIDILGVASEIAEIELILATSAALVALGLEQPRIRLNDRRVLAAIATHCGVGAGGHGEFFVILDKLDKIGREGVERELREAGYGDGAIGKLFELFRSAAGASADARLERLARTIPEAAEAAEGLRM